MPLVITGIWHTLLINQYFTYFVNLSIFLFLTLQRYEKITKRPNFFEEKNIKYQLFSEIITKF